MDYPYHNRRHTSPDVSYTDDYENDNRIYQNTTLCGGLPYFNTSCNCRYLSGWGGSFSYYHHTHLSYEQILTRYMNYLRYSMESMKKSYKNKT